MQLELRLSGQGGPGQTVRARDPGHVICGFGIGIARRGKSMHYLYLFSVWSHILAAMVWIGGSVFIALVLVPALRRPEFAAVFSPVLRRNVLRFRIIGWVCLTVLVISGLANLALRGFPLWGLVDGSLYQGAFGRILAIKLLLVAFILFISALHDFFL